MILSGFVRSCSVWGRLKLACRRAVIFLRHESNAAEERGLCTSLKKLWTSSLDFSNLRLHYHLGQVRQSMSVFMATLSSILIPCTANCASAITSFRNLSDYDLKSR